MTTCPLVQAKTNFSHEFQSLLSATVVGGPRETRALVFDLIGLVDLGLLMLPLVVVMMASSSPLVGGVISMTHHSRVLLPLVLRDNGCQT